MQYMDKILDQAWYAVYDHKTTAFGVKRYYFRLDHHYIIVACSDDDIVVYVKSIDGFVNRSHRATNQQAINTIKILKNEIEKNNIVL